MGWDLNLCPIDAVKQNLVGIQNRRLAVVLVLEWNIKGHEQRTICEPLG
jgi:hypothetical protein